MSEHKERPIFNFNFHGNVGQQIGNVEHMEVHFDKDMQMHVANVEEMSAPSLHPAAQEDKPLCVVLNSIQRRLLDAAEQKGIIFYNGVREGYDTGALASQALVAYLCGKIFCGDYTKDGVWREGKRFDDAKYCERLFGFDVAGTRRKTRGTGAGKSPIGYEKVDELWGK